MTVSAKRKNGTTATKGDDVLVIWDNGNKHFGRIIEVEGTRRFSIKKRMVTLQTYTIRCKDGVIRPAHAWHIKYASARPSGRYHRLNSNRTSSKKKVTNP